MRKAAWPGLVFVAAAVGLGFLALPVLALFTRVPPGELVRLLGNPVVRDAIVVSLKTTLIAQVLILLFGTPLAYLLATRRFPGRPVLVTLVENVPRSSRSNRQQKPQRQPDSLLGFGAQHAVNVSDGVVFGSVRPGLRVSLYTECQEQ